MPLQTGVCVPLQTGVLREARSEACVCRYRQVC